MAGDPDLGQTVSFSITGGNTLNAFSINSVTGEIQVTNASALDFETRPTFGLRIRANDNSVPSLFDESTVNISLIDVNENSLIVAESLVGVSYAQIRVSRILDTTKLNLIDSNGVFGASDLTLVGNTVGAVAGSIVLDADGKGFTFLKSGGPLVADTYTLTMRSAANGFVDTSGNLLDGNANGTAGDDYVRTFTVSAIPASTVLLSVPDFERGPGQPVNLPANTTNGLPIAISTGLNVRGASFSLNYNPAMLTITGGTTSIAGATVTIDTATAGLAKVTVTSASQFSAVAGALTLVNLVANVPTTAAIGTKALLRLSNVSLTSADTSTLTIATDDGVQVSAYKGDVNNSNSITTGDVTGLLRTLSGALGTTGFPSFKLADPTIVGDMNDSSSLTSSDAAGLLQFISGAAGGFPSIPALPTGLTPTTGADPEIFIPQNLTVTAGNSVTVPINVRVTEAAGVSIPGIDVSFTYDANRFTIGAITTGPALAGFTFTSSINTATAGVARLVYAAELGPAFANGFVGTLLNVTLTAQAGAAAGASPINLTAAGASDNNTNDLTISPAITVGVDSSDGVITIQGSTNNTPNYANVVLADAPAAYWRLGEASGTLATDSSTNGLHGTYENGVVYGVPGPVLGNTNTAIQFGSPSARVAVADNALLRPTSISLEAFVNVQGATTWDTVIAKTSVGWNNGYGIYYHQDNGGELRFFVNSFANYVSAPIPSNRYVHVVATYDGSSMRLYYDGVPVGIPRSFSTAINHSAQPLQIGWAADVSSYSFNGRIDEVSIFGRALTPAQVQSHYNATSSYDGLVLADSPTGYWRLGESGGTVATDASVNGRNGTYENGVVYGVVGAIPGDSNTAIQFGSANARVRIPDSPALRPASISLEAFVKVQGVEIWDTVIAKTTTGWSDGYGIYYHPANGGELRFFINNYTNYVAAPITLNQYVHIASTYDGSAMRLYFGGVQVASKAFNAAIVHSAEPLYLGWASGSSAYSFNGVLDEAAIYGTALTASQILKHAQALQPSDTTPPATLSFTRLNPATATTSADSLVFLATFSEPVTSVDSLDFAVNSTSTATVTGVVQVGTSNSYEVTVSGGNLASFNGTVGLNLSPANNIKDLAGLSLPATEPATDEVYTVSNSTGYDGAVLADLPTAYWRLGEASGSVATDASANGLNGTYENGVVYGVAGAIAGNTAIQFGNPNARVAVADSALLRPSSISLEAFVNVQGAAIWDTVISKTSAGWSNGYGIYYHPDNGGELRFFINGFTNYVAAPIPSNRYVHVAATYDGSTMRLYYDGVAVGTPKAFSAAINHSTQPLEIGWAPDVSSYSFNGRIDEVSIFGRALTPAQIQAHFRAASASYEGLVLSDSPTGYWRLGESSGAVATDASVNGRHGTYENSVVYGAAGAISGDSNTAIQFGGSNARVRVPDNASLRPSSISLEAFVKVQGAEIWDTVIAKTTAGWNDGYGVYYHPANGGELRFFINNYSNFVAAPIGANQYVHVAATYDGSAMKLYYGGVQVASMAYSVAIVHSAEALYLGWAPGSTTYSFNGTIDEVAIYGRALSAATIQSHASQSAAPGALLSATITGRIKLDDYPIDQRTQSDLEIATAMGAGLNGLVLPFGRSTIQVGTGLFANSEDRIQVLTSDESMIDAHDAQQSSLVSNAYIFPKTVGLGNKSPATYPKNFVPSSTVQSNDLASETDAFFGSEFDDLFDGLL